jgi:hypothetical protein
MRKGVHSWFVQVLKLNYKAKFLRIKLPNRSSLDPVYALTCIARLAYLRLI